MKSIFFVFSSTLSETIILFSTRIAHHAQFLAPDISNFGTYSPAVPIKKHGLFLSINKVCQRELSWQPNQNMT